MDRAVISMENSMENSMDGLLEKTTVKKPHPYRGGFLQGFQVPEKSASIAKVVEKFGFGAPPAIGSIFDYRGQIYTFTGTVPYVRQDGVTIELLGWLSHCARCGEPFNFTSTPTGGFNRRCQIHKAAGRRVREIAAAKDRAA